MQGTLDLLILKTIALEAKHGWAVAKSFQQISRDLLQVQQGSVYQAMHRIEQKAGSEPNGQKPRWEDRPSSIP